MSAINVSTSSGAQEFGIRVVLAREGRSDKVYLDIEQARRILREFSQLRRQDIPSSDCGVATGCYNQPVRCSPIQTMIQAICGSVYSGPTQEHGVAIRTPRGEFRFAFVPAVDFYEAFDAVIPMARRASRE